MFHIFFNLAFKLKEFAMCLNQVLKNFNIANLLLESVVFDKNRTWVSKRKSFQNIPKKASSFFFLIKKKHNLGGGQSQPMDHFGVAQRGSHPHLATWSLPNHAHFLMPPPTFNNFFF
jgi:uncharacterized protein (UPF0128 family)